MVSLEEEIVFFLLKLDFMIFSDLCAFLETDQVIWGNSLLCPFPRIAGLRFSPS